MRYLLDAVYLILIPILSLLLFASKSRRGLWNRFLGRTNISARSSKCRVWFHGVSVGEIHLLRRVVAQFRVRHPDIECIVSSTTDTGFEEANKAFHDLAVVRWPLDFSWAVERALREIRPDLIVLAESELWPNFLLAARHLSIPVVAINVRLSPRSARRYLRIRSLARRWLSLVSHFAVQTPEYAHSLHEIGVDSDRLTVTGSVKYDGAETDRANAKTLELRRLFRIGPAEIVWVAGSTIDPEEEIVLDACRRLQANHPNLRLILVPRQPHRFEPVAELFNRREIPFIRRTDLSTASLAPPSDAILLNTIGELSAAWGLADIAFVGGSLDGHRGGQNMIEPAAYGAAVLFGPHTWNFRETVRRLLEENAAIEVDDAQELEAAIERLLGNRAERGHLGECARRLVAREQGATGRTLELLERYLPESLELSAGYVMRTSRVA
jgi:3-deoxy-D-manno-octulosonic-acid transferase